MQYALKSSVKMVVVSDTGVLVEDGSGGNVSVKVGVGTGVFVGCKVAAAGIGVTVERGVDVGMGTQVASARDAQRIASKIVEF